MSIQQSIQHRPLGWYFGMNIAWISLYALMAYRSIPPDMKDGLGSIPPVLFLLVLVGSPSVFGLLLTGLLEGKQGVQALLSRYRIWRLGWKWYAAALLIPMALAGSTYVLQSWLGGPAPVIQWRTLAVGMGSGVISALMEEAGWRGFALPRLLKRTSPFRAALLLGMGWGGWHLALNFIGQRQHGGWMIPLAIITGPILLTGHTVLMVWISKHTRGSLLLMYLYHFSITMNAFFLAVNNPSTSDAIRQALVSAGVVWAAVILLVLLKQMEWKREAPQVKLSPAGEGQR